MVPCRGIEPTTFAFPVERVDHSTTTSPSHDTVFVNVFDTFRFILHAKKTGFVVEHDFIMATYLADRVIVFDGVPSIQTVANT